jgi:hypothetical protein
LEDCRLFRPDGIVKKCRNSDGDPKIPEIGTVSWPRNIDCDLYLYDGPPNQKPIGVKMIAFTSPNFSWLDSMRKERYHIKLFMPTWDFTELLAANEELELNIDEDEIENRYELFGGSARYCLSTENKFVSKGKTDIKTALSKINAFDQLRDCYFGNAELDTVVHRLMHYLPNDNPQLAELHPASELIKRMLMERLETKLNYRRVELLMWLEGSDKGSIFAGFLFESFIHERLLKGGQFEMRSLVNSSHSTIDINQTIGQYSRFKKNFVLDDIFKNIYQIPEAPNFPSIDSFIIIDDVVLMFQITKNIKHPVLSSGLVMVLKPLGKLDVDLENPLLAQLIFVVPKGMGENYQEQEITNSDAFTATNLETVSCDKIPGIGSKKNDRLKDLGIENCAQLISAYERDKEKFRFVSNAVQTLRDSRVNATTAEKIKNIPQFVIEVDYHPEIERI